MELLNEVADQDVNAAGRISNDIRIVNEETLVLASLSVPSWIDSTPSRYVQQAVSSRISSLLSSK